MGTKKTRASQPARTTRGPAARSKSRAKGELPSARTSSKHDLYQQSVQCPEAEVEFVEKVYTKRFGVRPVKIREDFCGTAYTSCEWVRRRKGNVAVGLDLHGPTIRWGLEHNAKDLDAEQRSRLRLFKRNVLSPNAEGRGVDAVLAMNFSYWVFQTRDSLRAYFASVKKSLKKKGLFYLDIMGGWESMKEQQERRRQKGFTYVWDQAEFDPITNRIRCHIHFEFKRKGGTQGPAMRKAFTYDWRLWTIPEVRELLAEAGFKASTVYWEGDDGKGGGNGVFKPQKKGEACESFIAYIVAE